MRTGKLQISRGSALVADARRRQLSLVQEPMEEGPARSIEDEAGHQTILARLDVLERLARLRSLELLSETEYAAEKAFILSRHGDEQSLPVGGAVEPRLARTGPSLAGRLFSWALLPLSLIAGLAFSFGVQPQETMRLFDQAISLFGA